MREVTKKLKYEKIHTSKKQIEMEKTFCASITNDAHHKSEAIATEQSYKEYDMGEFSGAFNEETGSSTNWE